MAVILISDLHLAPENPETLRAFQRFIDCVSPEQVESLYILGDLFEAWIGDDDESEFTTAVISKMQDLTRSGVKLFFQRGNRDFLLGKQFAQRTGGELLGDYYRLDHMGHQALLMHGDLLCTDDHDYIRFRRRVQNPVSRWLLSHLPLATRRRIAKRWRRQSAEKNANKAENIMDVNPTAVVDCLDRFSLTTLIHGHTHRPASHQITLGNNAGTRLVLGDWGQSIWWITADASGFSLLSAPISDYL